MIVDGKYKSEILAFQRQMTAVLEKWRLSGRQAGQGAPLMRVVVGLPDPGFVEAILAQTPHEALVLYLHAPDGCFDEARLQAIATRLDRIVVFVSLAPDAFPADKASMLATNLPGRQIQFCVPDMLAKRFEKEIKAVDELLKTTLSNERTDRLNALPNLRAFIRNLPLIARGPLLRPTSAIRGCPAVVCGAGPSLAGQLDLLRAHAKQVVVIAVGHAAPKLASCGIMPDFIVELDTLCHYNWQDVAVTGAALTAFVETSPYLTWRYDRHLWFVEAGSLVDMFLRNHGITLLPLRISMSASVSAIDLAAVMGCGPIALVGQDLCLSASGLSHVSNPLSDSSPSDLLIDVSGKLRTVVQTTPDLYGIKKALESYVADFFGAGSRRPPICNCTEDGAVLDGVQPMVLDEFLCACGADIDKNCLLEPSDSAGAHAIRVDRVIDGLRSYAGIVGKVSGSVSALVDEMSSTTPSLDKIRYAQGKMAELLRREEDVAGQRELAFCIAPLTRFADRIAEESNRQNGASSPLPMTDLAAIGDRHRCIHDVCADDLFEDLEWASGELRSLSRQPRSAKPPGNHLSFNAYRKAAAAFISRSNAELADALRSNALSDGERGRRFVVFPHWAKAAPMVRIRREDGTLLPLNDYYFMREVAEREVRAFVAATRFDPTHDAVVFTCPGNWIHPLVFAAQFPVLKMMAVDPWPELLAELADYVMWFHKLPCDTVIVAVHPSLSQWRTIACQRLETWKKTGRRVLFFDHPSAAALPECQRLRKELESKLTALDPGSLT